MKSLFFTLQYMILLALTGYCGQTAETSYNLGTFAGFRNELLHANNNSLTLTLANGNTVDVTINYQFIQQQEIHLQGSVNHVAGGSFSIDITGEKLEGRVLLPATGAACTYSKDADGNAIVSEADIRKLICYNYITDEEEAGGTTGQKPTTDPDVSNLQSNPGATGCLLLDMDGYEMPAGNYWNSGNAISAAASGMTNEDILKAWEIVAEDYYPFNLNVTTSEAVFNTYPQNKRSRCVVTPTNYFAPGTQGIGFTYSFLFMNEAPCWVFTTGTGLTGKRVGEASSHELGHTMGLEHDGVNSASYYGGHGNWAPIMGNGLNKPVTQWSKGEYNGATNTEDDLAIIAGPLIGVGYRLDDHGNVPASATILSPLGGVITSGQYRGFIGGTDDIDVFKFTTPGGTTALSVKTVTAYADVRLEVSLLNSAGTVINTYIANANDLSAPVAITASLPAGIYYLVINGAAAGSASGDYNDYSSLGRYEIMGSIVNNPLPVTMSPLSAELLNEHNTLLAWTTYMEKNTSGFRIMRSRNGKDFQEIGTVYSVYADGNGSDLKEYAFTDTASLSGTVYYRLTVAGRDGQLSFTNIVAVMHPEAEGLALSVFPNPVTAQLHVALKGEMGESPHLMLMDITGRMVLSATLNTPESTLDIDMLQAGTYLMKYTDDHKTLFRKIIKQ